MDRNFLKYLMKEVKQSKMFQSISQSNVKSLEKESIIKSRGLGLKSIHNQIASYD